MGTRSRIILITFLLLAAVTLFPPWAVHGEVYSDGGYVSFGTAHRVTAKLGHGFMWHKLPARVSCHTPDNQGCSGSLSVDWPFLLTEYGMILAIGAFALAMAGKAAPLAAPTPAPNEPLQQTGPA